MQGLSADSDLKMNHFCVGQRLGQVFQKGQNSQLGKLLGQKRHIVGTGEESLNLEIKDLPIPVRWVSTLPKLSEFQRLQL